MVVAATAVGAQSLEARFNPRRSEDAPPVALWRCNLTGLSQVHNLYFVAYAADIYVYTPQFPSQRIAEEPSLIFTSQPSAPRLTGRIDPRTPHAINNLAVQFLGNEEIVAVVRDDGDVDAFLVRHIFHAIERREEPFSELGLLGDEIRPFFQSNVGKSAWGLAVHAQARILATSANTHEVRVFKFGLLQAEDSNETSEDDATPDVADNKIREQQERKTDVTYEILNGEANIPYIAFCNTGDDPEGRWLLTTDIMGVCQVMDLFEMKPKQKFRFGRSFAPPNLLGVEDRFDRLNAGWILMFLDRRSFLEEDSLEAALGFDNDESLPGVKRNPTIWDISKTVQRLPEYSEPFVYHRSKRRRNGQRPSGNEISRVDEIVNAATAGSGEEHHEDDRDSNASSDGGAQLELEAEIPQQAQHQGDAPGISEDLAAQDGATDETTSTDDDSDSDLEPPPTMDDAEDPDDEMTEDTTPFTAYYNGESITGNEPQFAIKDTYFWDKLPCPILHASVRNIYLLQPFTNKQDSAGPWSPPMVGLANPLRQSIQQDFQNLRMFERLNMTVSIPQLGVVVLASQKGRAIVLSLTKIPASAQYPPDMFSSRQQADASERLAWMNKTNYTMRVECILPFAVQERANQRPFAPLHGIAAAPLQGCGGDGKNGARWRVMIMYQDHSILSYEIGRKVSAAENGIGRGKGVQVEELLV